MRHAITASRTVPTLCVPVIITGPSRKPDSSIQCVPVISPLPFRLNTPAFCRSRGFDSSAKQNRSEAAREQRYPHVMILSAMTDPQIVTQVPFARAFTVGWEHLDSNGHMANTAYLNLAVTTRMMFFQANGFAMQEFEKQRFGPVVRRDEIEYFRELRLLEPVRVALTLAAMSDDGSHFRLRNEFFRSDGKSAAIVTTTGGWLDLAIRRLTAPPEAIVLAYQTLVRTEDFETLKSSVK